MTVFETFKIAARALMANKMRSALTMLGIIIGVASVVTMVAIGAGARAQIEQQIRSLGANVLMVLPGAATQSGVRMESGTMRALSEADALAISTDLQTVSEAAPSVLAPFQIIAGNLNWRTGVNGTTSVYFVIREWGLYNGRYFSQSETEAGEKVALIGSTVAEQLFGTRDAALGQSVRILNSRFEIIGVLAEKGTSGAGRDQDDIVFVPITTAKQRLIGGANQLDRDNVDYILLKARSDREMRIAEYEVAQLLRMRHGLRPGRPDDFRIADPAASMQAQTASADTLAWLLGSVAAVSMIVGGISIMNIMLVSVTERRREIGLRRAIGARKSHIRRQFLIEAFSLCLMGGLLGLFLGVAAAIIVSHFAGWPIFLTPGSMGLAMLFSGFVGLLFGYYPAKKAANEDPIVCMRAE